MLTLILIGFAIVCFYALFWTRDDNAKDNDDFMVIPERERDDDDEIQDDGY